MVRAAMSEREGIGASKFESFRGWRALVTGGSSGIGLALAKALVADGAHVCIVARDAIRLAEAEAELKSNAGPGIIVCHVPLDVARDDAIPGAVQRAVEQLGGLDLLINNAGYARPGYVDELSDQVYVDMMAVNYFGPMRLTRACLPYFVRQGEGRIVNVTSMLGFMGTFGYSAYCASKYALSGFTEALRQDALPFGVRVHLCYPPTTQTPGLERENRDKPPEAWAIEGKSRAFSAEQVSGSLLRGVRAGKFQIVVGFDSWVIWFAQRLVPWLVRWVVDRVLKKELKKREPGPLLQLPR